MKFEIRKSDTSKQQYWWRIVSGNGRILASSEMYSAKADAISAANSVKADAGGSPIYDVTGEG